MGNSAILFFGGQGLFYTFINTVLRCCSLSDAVKAGNAAAYVDLDSDFNSVVIRYMS